MSADSNLSRYAHMKGKISGGGGGGDKLTTLRSKCVFQRKICSSSYYRDPGV